MANIADLTLADNVPTNHVFYAMKSGMTQSSWLTREMVTSQGQRGISASMSLASKTRPTDRVAYRYAFPFEYVEDGVTKVRDIARANVDFVIPELMTNAERAMFYAVFMSGQDNALLKNWVLNRDPTI
jgi:hypothetical protein